MHIPLELNVVEDDFAFLNFWDSMHGNDVVCEVRAGKLFHKNGPITLAKFIQMVQASMEKAYPPEVHGK